MQLIATFKTLLFVQSRHSKLYCLCNRDIQNFIVCAVATFKTLLFVQSRHSKLYCLCSRDIQNFVCAVATFKTLLFVQSRHSKLYCLCNRDIQNFIVCAIATFKTLFVQSRHSKLYCLCSRAIRNFLVCVSLLGLRTTALFPSRKKVSRRVVVHLACVASVSVGFQSRERPKNEILIILPHKKWERVKNGAWGEGGGGKGNACQQRSLF